MRFQISFQVRKKPNQTKNKYIYNSYVPSSIILLELALFSLLRIQCLNIIQQDKGNTLEFNIYKHRGAELVHRRDILIWGTEIT